MEWVFRQTFRLETFPVFGKLNKFEAVFINEMISRYNELVDKNPDVDDPKYEYFIDCRKALKIVFGVKKLSPEILDSIIESVKNRSWLETIDSIEINDIKKGKTKEDMIIRMINDISGYLSYLYEHVWLDYTPILKEKLKKTIDDIEAGEIYEVFNQSTVLNQSKQYKVIKPRNDPKLKEVPKKKKKDMKITDKNKPEQLQLNLETVANLSRKRHDRIYHAMETLQRLRNSERIDHVNYNSKPHSSTTKLIEFALKVGLKDYVEFEGLMYTNEMYKIGNEKILEQYKNDKLFEKYSKALDTFFISFNNYEDWLEEYFEKGIDQYLRQRNFNMEKTLRTEKGNVLLDTDTYTPILKAQLVRNNMLSQQKGHWEGKFKGDFPFRLLIVLQINFLYGLNTLFPEEQHCYDKYMSCLEKTDMMLFANAVFENATDSILFETKKCHFNGGSPVSLEMFIELLKKTALYAKELFTYVFMEYSVTRAFTNYSVLLEENKKLINTLEEKRRLAGSVIELVKAYDQCFDTHIIEDVVNIGVEMDQLQRESNDKKSLLNKEYECPRKMLEGNRVLFTDFIYPNVEDKKKLVNNDLLFQWDKFGKVINVPMTSNQMVETEYYNNVYVQTLINFLRRRIEKKPVTKETIQENVKNLLEELKGIKREPEQEEESESEEDMEMVDDSDGESNQEVDDEDIQDVINATRK